MRVSARPNHPWRPRPTPVPSTSAYRTHPVRGKGRSPPACKKVRRTFFRPVVRTPGAHGKKVVMSTHSEEPARKLPENPDLRHLKDQAKGLLKAGQAESLARAQFQIARQYGFASWPK